MVNIFHCSYTIFFIASIGTVILLFPGLTNFDFNLEDSSLQESLRSQNYCTSLIVLLSTTVPLLIDTFLDIFVGLNTEKEKQYCIGRSIIAISLFVSVLCLIYHPINMIQNFLVISNFQRIILTTSLLFCLSIADRNSFSLRKISGYGLLLNVDTILRMYSTSHMGANSMIWKIIVIITSCLLILATLLFIIIWCYTLYLKNKRSIKFALSDINCSLYMLLFVFVSCSCIEVSNTRRDYFSTSRNTSSNYLAVIMYIYSILVIMLTIIPHRIHRDKAVAQKVFLFFIFIFVTGHLFIFFLLHILFFIIFIFMLLSSLSSPLPLLK